MFTRFRFIFGLFLLGFLAISLRLFYWQILKHNELLAQAQEQYYFQLEILPTRGEILSSDGAPLVSNKTGYLAYAEIPNIEQKELFADKIAEVLQIDEKKLFESISQENIVWYPIKHRLDSDTQQKLSELNLKGLGFEKESLRFYPEGSMAAHLLGFVGQDKDGNDKGYLGIEGFYESGLKGKSGQLIQEKDAYGAPILLGTGKRIPAENGQSLELFVDRSIQYIAEKELHLAIEKYGAKEGLVAIMDPKTGGIIASAAFPKYDPQKYFEADPQLFPNPLVAKTYEPGSTFKTLVMAAAINERMVDSQTIFNEDGPVKIDEYSVKTWNEQYHGNITMTQVLENSSNPGMVFVGRKLGKQKLFTYLKNYGFGELSGIDLQDEEKSEVRSYHDWADIDLAAISFGQGIAVTPIQMLRAVGAIANQGKLMEPRLVKSITNSEGKKLSYEPHVSLEVLKPKTAKTVTEMMIAAVNKGDAKWAKPKGYKIAGKTGTAQIPVAGHYEKDKTIASFVGFAPANDPKFVMLTLLREPQTSQWGSETAAPLFFNIAKQLLNYYGIPPDS